MVFIITLIGIMIFIYIIGLILEGLGFIILGSYHTGKAIKTSYNNSKYQKEMSVDKIDEEYLKPNEDIAFKRVYIKNINEITEIENLKITFDKITIKKVKFLRQQELNNFNDIEKLNLQLNEDYSLVSLETTIENNSQNTYYITHNKALCLSNTKEQSYILKTFDNYTENNNNFLSGVKQKINYNFLFINSKTENIEDIMFYLKLKNNEISKKFKIEQ